jgi:hypothetical protein
MILSSDRKQAVRVSTYGLTPMNIFLKEKKDFPFSLSVEKRVEWLIRKNQPKTGTKHSPIDMECDSR